MILPTLVLFTNLVLLNPGTLIVEQIGVEVPSETFIEGGAIKLDRTRIRERLGMPPKEAITNPPVIQRLKFVPGDVGKSRLSVI